MSCGFSPYAMSPGSHSVGHVLWTRFKSLSHVLHSDIFGVDHIYFVSALRIALGPQTPHVELTVMRGIGIALENCPAEVTVSSRELLARDGRAGGRRGRRATHEGCEDERGCEAPTQCAEREGVHGSEVCGGVETDGGLQMMMFCK